MSRKIVRRVEKSEEERAAKQEHDPVADKRIAKSPLRLGKVFDRPMDVGEF